jgi:hypothetical protein
MPVVRRAVLGAVLAHQRHRDPIGKGDAAEAKWFEAGRAVFSVGSITSCGSLSHNNYQNNISRMLENVLRRFLTK